MTTANAVTDEIGHTISGSPAFSGITCKTEQFKIDSSYVGNRVFLDAYYFDWIGSADLGELLGSTIDRIQIMAQCIYENGGNLHGSVEVFGCSLKHNIEYELRVKHKRYMCASKRVYSKDI